jgi:hypothetical protein
MDKIDTIKTLILQRIEYHTNKLDELRAKLKRAEEVEAMLPDLVPLSASVGPCNLSDDPDPPVKPGKPYSRLSLTEAVKLALVHGAASPKTLRELREMLGRGGYPVSSVSSSFSAALNATLHRLETQGLITIGEDDDERKTFARKI